MRDYAAEVENLRTISTGAQLMTEGGVPYVYLKELRIDVRNSSVTCDALLCLQATAWGYPTKLLLSQRIGNPNLNWNVQPVIFGKVWHTWSWTGVGAELPLLDILLGHIGALR